MGSVDQDADPNKREEDLDYPWRIEGRRRCLPVCKFLSSYRSDQLAFSRREQSLFTIFKALVGQKETQRWQFTQLLSSHTICLVFHYRRNVDAIGALLLADTAGNAAVFISDDFKFRIDKFYAH